MAIKNAIHVAGEINTLIVFALLSRSEGVSRFDPHVDTSDDRSDRKVSGQYAFVKRSACVMKNIMLICSCCVDDLEAEFVTVTVNAPSAFLRAIQE